MKNILITLHPFSKHNGNLLARLLQICKANDYTIIMNPYQRKLQPTELMNLITIYSPEIIIAGTEYYPKNMYDTKEAHAVKLIIRAGVGYDNVPLQLCEMNGTTVSYTPEAPSDAVAEIVLCQMVNLLRKTQDILISRARAWNRYIGRQLNSSIVGVIGCGRIGGRVIRLLLAYGVKTIYVNDIISEIENGFAEMAPDIIKPASLDQLLPVCDIVTLHVPGNESTCDMITDSELSMMKYNARLLNYSRGGIINENALCDWLQRNPKACAAVDVFNEEPYNGKLATLRNAYLTAHIGSCTIEARNAMEGGAVDAVDAYINGHEIKDVLVYGR